MLFLSITAVTYGGGQGSQRGMTDGKQAAKTSQCIATGMEEAVCKAAAVACMFMCVFKYLDVLHHVSQLNQELLGLSGSV